MEHSSVCNAYFKGKAYYIWVLLKPILRIRDWSALSELILIYNLHKSLEI